MTVASSLAMTWSRSSNTPQDFRVQGFDPLLLVAQIIALTALHYLSLAFICPILLHALVARDEYNSVALLCQGGSYNVAMLMDWRNLAGRLGDLGQVLQADTMLDQDLIDGGQAAISWVLAASWILVSLLEVVYLYTIIRRPTYILDFALTLLFNHLLLTTYYTSSFPTSPFIWLLFLLSATAQIVWAEQLCIKREMKSNLTVSNWKVDRDDQEVQRRTATTLSGGGTEVAMGLLGASVGASGSGDKDGYSKVSTQEQ